MNREELIEVLKQFNEKRVEELPEKTRNIFYAIMKIADERDRLNNIINELEIFIKNNKVTIGIKKDSNYAIPVEYVLDKLKELKENNK